MKERYLSKTPFLTFVYISKCNINLPGYFGNSKKRFLWTGLPHMLGAVQGFANPTGLALMAMIMIIIFVCSLPCIRRRGHLLSKVQEGEPPSNYQHRFHSSLAYTSLVDHWKKITLRLIQNKKSKLWFGCYIIGLWQKVWQELCRNGRQVTRWRPKL